MNYKPLPDSLTIKRSEINGLGLFAKEDIAYGTLLGLTHVKSKHSEDGWVRTPLGGFYNHSVTPNCASITMEKEGAKYLCTTSDIKAGDEITCKYTLYDPEKE